ncbi:hypothetical protein ACRAWF_29240 [Streptomyces sp. L7]
MTGSAAHRPPSPGWSGATGSSTWPWSTALPWKSAYRDTSW